MIHFLLLKPPLTKSPKYAKLSIAHWGEIAPTKINKITMISALKKLKALQRLITPLSGAIENSRVLSTR